MESEKAWSYRRHPAWWDWCDRVEIALKELRREQPSAPTAAMMDGLLRLRQWLVERQVGGGRD